MRLANARLCLDCDEVHEDARCPTCASESFAFITRWVTPERATPPRVPPQPPSETADTYRALLDPQARPRGAARRLLRGGAIGLAVLGAAGWWLRRRPDDMGGPETASRDTETQNAAATDPPVDGRPPMSR